MKKKMYKEFVEYLNFYYKLFSINVKCYSIIVKFVFKND